MSIVTIHDDGSIAIPSEIRKQLAVKPGDSLEASVEGGALHLRPVLRDSGESFGRKVDLSPWFGKGRSFASAEEIDNYIREERDSWD